MAADPTYFAIYAERDLADEAYALGLEFSRIADRATVGEVGATFSYFSADDIAETASVADDVFSLAIDATGGTFTLVYNSDATDDIDFDADADAIAAALGALVGVQTAIPDRYNVAVFEISAGTAYGIQFVGDEANEIHTLTADSTSLTGGTHTAATTQVMLGGTIAAV